MAMFRVGVARAGFEEKMKLAETYSVDISMELSDEALVVLTEDQVEILVEAAAIDFLQSQGIVEGCDCCWASRSLRGLATVFEQEFDGEIVGWEVDF